jgi:hypothetical protein
VCISVVFVASLGLYGLQILLVLLFAVSSSFIVPVVVFLFSGLPRIFGCLFVSMFVMLCVGIVGWVAMLLLTDLIVCVLDGFVFLLSLLFF